MLLGCLTMTLSCGSIVFGVVTGFLTLPKCIEMERNRMDIELNDPK